MGLLDDAIRDHLDLKRRHGADPVELERAEREALGPVRRKGDVAAAEYPEDVDGDYEVEPDEASVGSSPVAYDQAEDQWDSRDDEPVAEEPELEPPSPKRSRRPANGDADQDQPRGLAARFGLRGRRTEQEEDEPEDELEPQVDEPLAEDEPTRVHSASDPRAARSQPIGPETAEHDVEGASPVEDGERTPGEDGEDDDMLEETPEFLQDTPDHDRLWFEQRPPRDFDFDG